jgi:hypothetical protein
LLRGTGPNGSEALQLLKQLFDRLTVSASIEEQLDKIISSTTGLEAWRHAFVQVPAAIEYCGQRAIRRISPQRIYLLKRSQMNGTHVELFTYCLYRTLSTKWSQLRPLRLSYYVDSSGTDIEPHIVMVLSQQDFSATVKAYFMKGDFVIGIDPKQVESHPEVLAKLCTFGFQHNSLSLEKKTTHTDVERTLDELSKIFLLNPENEVDCV